MQALEGLTSGMTSNAISCQTIALGNHDEVIPWKHCNKKTLHSKVVNRFSIHPNDRVADKTKCKTVVICNRQEATI